MQQAIFLPHAIMATVKARILSEPPVDPNWIRMGDTSMMCVWKTPTSAAIETIKSRRQTVHLDIRQGRTHVCCCGFLERMAIKKEGKEISGD